MSVAATLALAWAAVHAFVVVYSLALYRRMGSGREYLAFAVASFGMILFCAGAAQLTHADNVAEGTDARTLQFVGVPVSLAAFIVLVCLLAERPPRRLAQITVTWCGLAVMMNLMGLFFDPADPAPPPRWGQLLPGPRYHEPMMQPLALTFSLGGIALLVVALVYGVRRSSSHDDLRWILLAGIPGILAWVFDTGVRLLPVGSRYLFEHVSIVTSFGINYTLIRRFVRAEDALNQRTNELRQSYDELHHIQEELIRTEQLAAVGELSAVIAHELQHPLNALKDAVTGLRDRNLDQLDRNQLLAVLDEESDRLNRLVRDLLAYARPVEPQYEPVELEQIISRAAAESTAENPRAEEIDFDIDLAGTSAAVYGDPDLLQRAMANVIENAVQAMPSGGLITVRAHETHLDGGSAVAIGFHDTGEGMDTLVRSRATDPFFTTRPSGTGLGLAIVDRFVRAHGGQIELHSEETGGTTVTILLPRDRRSSVPPPQQ